LHLGFSALLVFGRFFMQTKIAVYTAIYGDVDGLLPQPGFPGVDYICFSDRPRKAAPWEVRVLPSGNQDNNRAAKIFKILPHLYLPEYEWSIWIDGNYLIVGNIPQLISSLPPGVNMACFDHSQTVGDARNCIYKEYEKIIELGRITGRYKDSPDIMLRQIQKYRDEGFPAESGLISGGVLLRRHLEADVTGCMEKWWEEISEGSRRDQLSFNYAAWKQGFRFHYLEGNIRNNPWFFQIGIHRSDYRRKLFSYRLKRFFGIIRHSS
jgi:hypothetical protein